MYKKRSHLSTNFSHVPEKLNNLAASFMFLLLLYKRTHVFKFFFFFFTQNEDIICIFVQAYYYI